MGWETLIIMDSGRRRLFAGNNNNYDAKCTIKSIRFVSIYTYCVGYSHLVQITETEILNVRYFVT